MNPSDALEKIVRSFMILDSDSEQPVYLTNIC